jgi:DnaJ-class molecular chaperone
MFTRFKSFPKLISVRYRHSMTNFYETLNLNYKATNEEIEKAYRDIEKMFGNSPDLLLKTFFDDAKLAYTTLSNLESKKEYDQYLQDHMEMASY